MSMERIKPTRSGLFAIELLIAVGVFSLCAAICVGLFVRAEVMSQDSANLSRAVGEARTAAECFKAAGGDLEKTAALAGGSLEGGALRLYYDGDWQKTDECGTDVETLFLLELLPETSATAGYATVQLRVSGPVAAEDLTAGALPEGAAILSWRVAAWEVAP